MFGIGGHDDNNDHSSGLWRAFHFQPRGLNVTTSALGVGQLMHDFHLPPPQENACISEGKKNCWGEMKPPMRWHTLGARGTGCLENTTPIHCPTPSTINTRPQLRTSNNKTSREFHQVPRGSFSATDRNTNCFFITTRFSHFSPLWTNMVTTPWNGSPGKPQLFNRYARYCFKIKSWSIQGNFERSTRFVSLSFFHDLSTTTAVQDTQVPVGPQHKGLFCQHLAVGRKAWAENTPPPPKLSSKVGHRPPGCCTKAWAERRQLPGD